MTPNALSNELRLLWRAHARVGLTGKMCLYSRTADNPHWPSKTPDLQFWFGPEEIPQAVNLIVQHYNNGNFPYTPLLLNTVVHLPNADGTYVPSGSGFYYANGFTIHPISVDKVPRLNSLGILSSPVSRNEADQAGLKMLAFSSVALAVDRGASNGSRELYEFANIDGEAYWQPYLLSGMLYLSNTGSYRTVDFGTMFNVPNGNELLEDSTLDAIIDAHQLPLQTLLDANHCWNQYDRHPTLYTRFGNDVPGLVENLKLYHYCARDFQFFDSIGPQALKAKAGAGDEDGFEFLVHGLIPRGSIVLLAGTGGTGKSSIAHKLCTLVATDWNDDEHPMWLGQPVNKALSKGVCVYFSGEDGPAIINARNELFDPNQRAKRLMFQRTDFYDAKGEETSFAAFLGRLKQMPEVPLLVIDPARKYLTGDEDDSAVVSEFFEAIEKFAHDRNTAVIVVHHLSKGAKPKTARDVVDELRGSQVFIDRPRVVIGMFREGPRTVVGLGKCNIPPSLGMVIDERVFAHNPKTLDLTQLPGPEGVRSPYAPAEDEDA